eukprot:COSAG01_NODE_68303_length_264_cov_0.945455_1_plen_62_part_10
MRGPAAAATIGTWHGHQPIIAIISRSFAASEGTEAAAKPCAPMEDDSSEEEPEQLQCKCILL